MRVVFAMLLVTVPVAAGCGHKAKEGLPPAESWDQLKSAGAMVPVDPGQRPRTMAGRSADPHAGVPGAPPIGGGMGGGDPHAGLDMGGGMGGGDPHAGLDMGGGMGGGDPHAGMGTGGTIDVTQLGLAPPDPTRKIDPSRRVKGTIRVAAAAKGRVKPNGAVFVVIRRAGTDGQPTGTVLAVEKLTWAGDAIPFELTEANAMSAGTELTGDVVVMARYDQDSDAISKQPGDVTGQVRTKVPTDQLQLTLDTILP
ncbi:MAG TPA: hypothetical protein VK932_04550 [Kofleriaceae bacterium]|nr:hypothetical protein [Kofleriaceae bacterium]